jgi:hypothetical protein
MMHEHTMNAPAPDRLLPALLLALTAVTGFVDAVSYVALGHVFTANMTGNVVFIGFAMAAAPGLSIDLGSRRGAFFHLVRHLVHDHELHFVVSFSSQTVRVHELVRRASRGRSRSRQPSSPVDDKPDAGYLSRILSRSSATSS